MAGSMVGDKDLGQLVTNRGGHSRGDRFFGTHGPLNPSTRGGARDCCCAPHSTSVMRFCPRGRGRLKQVVGRVGRGEPKLKRERSGCTFCCRPCAMGTWGVQIAVDMGALSRRARLSPTGRSAHRPGPPPTRFGAGILACVFRVRVGEVGDDLDDARTVVLRSSTWPDAHGRRCADGAFGSAGASGRGA